MKINFKLLGPIRLLKGSRLGVSKSRFNADTLSAMTFVKEGRLVARHITRCIYLLGGRLSPNWARLSYSYLKELNRLKRAMGLPGVVKYLKVCSVITQQVIAGYRIPDLGPLGMRVSRSKSGLPRLIPAYQRKLIKKSQYRVIKWWLTVLSLYRDIHFKGQLKLSTITNPSTATSSQYELKRYVSAFSTLYRKGTDISFKPYSSLSPMLTSGPQSSRSEGVTNSGPLSVLRSLALWNQPENEHLKRALLFLMVSMKVEGVKELWDKLSGSKWTPHYKDVMKFRPSSPYLGRLSIKEEAAGKVRVFAMVDPWTQWVLKPLHRMLFRLLSRIPMDGTFNQLKPLMRVPFGKSPIYSFDLSAATDRLPIWIQEEILASLFGNDFAQCWVSVLVGRKYKTPSRFELRNVHVKGVLPDDVQYSVGQPMGALSSWAMLAVTHHFIVQYSAWISCVVPVGQWFTKYAVLGDDIVIWDKTVANRYKIVMDQLGVEIGLAKSIISLEGEGLEFAKRTLLQGKDVSPIPFKEMSSAHRNFAALRTFSEKYNLNALQMIRFLGYGYKVDPTKNSKVNRLLSAALAVPRSSKELISLFLIDRKYIDWLEGVYPREEVFKSLLILIWGELHSLRKRLHDVHSTLRAYDADVYVRSIGPWKTPEAIVEQATSAGLLSEYLPELDVFERTCNRLIFSITPMYRGFTWRKPSFLPYIWLPSKEEQLDPDSVWSRFLLGLDPQYRFRDYYTRFPHSFIGFINFIYEAQNVVDRIQVDLLMNPKPGFSASPSFEEERRTLALWNKWSTIVQKVTPIGNEQTKLPRIK